MRRVAFAILLGLALTVALAASSALRPYAVNYRFATHDPQAEAWWIADTIPRGFVSVAEAAGAGPEWSVDGFMRASVLGRDEETFESAPLAGEFPAEGVIPPRIWRSRSGLPWRAAEAATWSDLTKGGKWTEVGALRLPPSRWRSEYLPLRVLWPGFVGDVVVWSLAAWLVLVVPRALIRKRRLRSGRCVACGHPLAGAERCPECGGGRGSE